MKKRKKSVRPVMGAVYHQLTVVGFSHADEKSRKYWDCVCSCGSNTTVRGDNLKSGHTSTCGHIKTIVSEYKMLANGCIICTNRGASRGYTIKGNTESSGLLHIQKYLKEYGPGSIPEGFICHHNCFNKACVNPLHLKVMSQGDHMRLHLGKPVRQLTLDGELVKIWPSMADAAKNTVYNDSCISATCLGKRKTHAGFRWEQVIKRSNYE